MDMNRYTVLCMGLVVLVLLLISFPVSAQNLQESQFFSETGHWVQGKFLETWNVENKGYLLYGFPITEEFDSGGLRVQYFQRGRMELHTELPEQLQIQISTLGTELWNLEKGRFLESDQKPTNSAACTLVDGSPYPICYAFKKFYEEQNGPSRFGKPISNVGTLDGILVQYFEMARFEWHPEFPAGQQVALGKIGQSYFDAKEDQKWTMPQLSSPGGDITRQPIKEIRLNAFPFSATLESSGQQKIHIIALNQNYQPIESAIVSITIKLPSGKTIEDKVTTNRFGIAVYTFALSGEKTGSANIQASVTVTSLPTKTCATAFRIR